MQAETIYDEDSDGGGDADDDIEDKDLEPQQAPGGEPEQQEAQAQTDGHTDGNVRTPIEMLSFLHAFMALTASLTHVLCRTPTLRRSRGRTEPAGRSIRPSPLLYSTETAALTTNLST